MCYLVALLRLANCLIVRKECALASFATIIEALIEKNSNNWVVNAEFKQEWVCYL